jgi:hypothetical protein
VTRGKIAAAAATVLASGALLFGIAQQQDEPRPIHYPSIADAKATFDGDFDADCRLTDGDGGWDDSVVGTDYPGAADIERTQRVQGKCSGAFWNPGRSGDQTRAELAHRFPDHSDIVYEFAAYVPSTIGLKANLTQHKQGGEGGSCYNGGIGFNTDDPSPDFALRVVSECDNGDETTRWFDLGPIPYDRWQAYRVRLYSATDGFAKVQIDPDAKGPANYTTVVPRTSLDTVSDPDTELKLRAGLYGRTNNGQRILIDAFRAKQLRP